MSAKYTRAKVESFEWKLGGRVLRNPASLFFLKIESLESSAVTSAKNIVSFEIEHDLSHFEGKGGEM